MKSSGQKLKKLKTRRVYGFKRDQFIIGDQNGDPTTLTTITTSHIILNGVV
jgi:hypothetical protein